MNKNYYITLVALAVLSACAKMPETEVEGPRDPLIHFGLSTYPDADEVEQSKTVYSGELVGNPKYERINWKVGTDRVRILSNLAMTKGGAKSADYTVTRSTNTGKTGVVTDEANAQTTVDNDALYWTDTDKEHYFFSLYPASDNITLDAGEKTATIAGTVSTVQTYISRRPVGDVYEFDPNMDEAYMYAGTRTLGSEKVQLQFKPLFSAIKFMLVAGDKPAKDFKIQSLKLTSETSEVTGDFSAVVNVASTGYTGTAPVTVGANTYKYAQINVADADQEAMGDKSWCFTFLALPVDLTTLTLDVTFASKDENGDYTVIRHRKLNLKKRDVVPAVWYTLGAKRKLYVKANLPEIKYVFDVTQKMEDFQAEGDTKSEFYQITSYRQHYDANGNLDESKKEKLNWEAIEYNDGSGWTPTKPSWLSAFTDNGEGSFDASPYDLGTEEVASVNQVLDLENDTPDKAINLGNYDFLNQRIYRGWTNDSEVPFETANCYVVSAPGWYKIPLVYGNSYHLGSINSGAYSNSLPESTPGLLGGNFPVQSSGARIKGPWLTRATNATLNGETNVGQGLTWFRKARLLWQDVENMVYVPTESDPDYPQWLDKNGGESYNSITNYVDFDAHYLYFKVNSVAGGGNAVVAACNNDGIQVGWSWHIWVVPPGRLATKKVYYYTDPKYNDIVFPSTFGWATIPGNMGDDSAMTHLTYNEMLNMNVGFRESVPGRFLLIKFRQDITGEIRQIHVVQRGKVDNSGAIHFQWGRKDPMFTVAGSGDYSMTIYMGDGTTRNSLSDLPSANYYETFSGLQVIGQSIKAPTEYMTTETNKQTWSVGRFDNLWDMSITAAMTSESEHSNTDVKKTIYDPCPPGFKVPNEYAFTGFNLKAMDQQVKLGDKPTDIINGLESSFLIGPNPSLESQGMWLYCNPADPDDGLMYFPAAGRRHGRNGGQFQDIYVQGFYWTAAPFFTAHDNLYARTFIMRRNNYNLLENELPQCIPVYTRPAAEPSSFGAPEELYPGFERAHAAQVRPIRDVPAGTNPVLSFSLGTLTLGYGNGEIGYGDWISIN